MTSSPDGTRWQGVARTGSLATSMENAVCCASNIRPARPGCVPLGAEGFLNLILVRWRRPDPAGFQHHPLNQK